MTKSLKTLLLAACILTTSTPGLMSTPTTYAYTQLIASLQEVSIFKDTLAIGEKAKLELTWSNGAHPELIYSSSDESVATVDQDGIVTGIANGTATITVSRLDGKNTKTLDISVSSDVEKSIIYNTSELNLGDKLCKYDILHYDNKNKGANANVVNTKGSYDLVFINEKDYVLPFDAEYVGDWGSCMYLAPDIEGITYLDGRTLNVDDVIDRNTHLLCYDYYIKSAESSNRMTFPVFLPEYYGKYIGNGEIRLSSIDHDSKTIELKSVPVDLPASKLLHVEITSNPYDTVIHGSDELDLTGLRLTIGETDSNGNSISQLENITIDEARKTYDITVEIKDEAPGSGNCQIIVTKKNEEIYDTASFAVSYGAPVVKGDVNSDNELNIADAVGLGVFTCIGATIAFEEGCSWYGIILFGVITATVGGMVRDVLAHEVPFVLQKEIYASASVAGGFLFIALDSFNVNIDLNILLTSVFVALIRIVSIYKSWNLPKIFIRGRS